ncbi:hypothetical protein K450DRAFT_260019 [Umbelopsis ramanniana AG]|uniref:Uncharacterized protein n=1 Tax=Umbelopsis ramanniana AG TaxID=1314678 RepID=A0AAD5E2Q2_UMBRA|nr:uncharacterized protein K450DRAFT_260019 [Umbelopsis ramanniana AG]KAI8575812.1 hypothetical protein K450DRAFT_260019 [Umbelopsis ramanniana AG]
MSISIFRAFNLLSSILLLPFGPSNLAPAHYLSLQSGDGGKDVVFVLAKGCADAKRFPSTEIQRPDALSNDLSIILQMRSIYQSS